MKVWVCTHEYNAHGGQKIALDPFEIVTSHCEPPDVGARNQTQILCKTPTLRLSADPTLNFIFKVLL